MHRAMIIAAWLVAMSCARSHPVDPDAAQDGGPPHPECSYAGSHQICDEICSDCPDEEQTCFRRPVCSPSISDCMLNLPPRGLGASLDDYCPDGSFCMSTSLERDNDAISGDCVDRGACEWLRDRAGEERCLYSDGTEFISGPPTVSECPAPAERFCGGPCGPCGEYPELGGFLGSSEVACLGQSEERGIGLCVAGSVGNTHCTPDTPPDFYAIMRNRWVTLLEMEVEVRCFVPRDAETGELAEFGYFVQRQPCLTYRSMYPGAGDCFTPDWTRDPG
jgi:hypothetical protein